MLKSMTIENFKCFASKIEIPLAPITLLYGENGAGKSSIIQALSLIQRIGTGAEGGRVNLAFPSESNHGPDESASFRSLVTNGDSDRSMSMHVVYSANEAFWTTCRRTDGADGDTGSLNPTVFDVSVTYRAAGRNGGCLSALSVVAPEGQWSEPELLQSLYNFFSSNRIRIRDCASTEIVAECLQNIANHPLLEQLKEIEADLDGLMPSHPVLEQFRATTEFQSQEAHVLANDPGLREIRDFYSKPFTFEEFVSRVASHPNDWGISFGEDPVIPTCREYGLLPFNCISQGTRNEVYNASNEMVTADLVWEPTCFSVNTPTLSLSGMTSLLRQKFGFLSSHFFALHGTRANPKRAVQISHDKPGNVGLDGSAMTSCLFHYARARERINGLLDEWEIGYRIHVDESTIRVTDTRVAAQPQITIADVGFGMSQLLPILTQALMRKAQILAIQQPEEHLHPRLQAELGSFFAENAKTSYNQFIVETHSEHLMLRIQKLIRTGKLKPSDVAVLYVSRGDDGSNVQLLRLDEAGEFLDPWPAGFFPERLQEILG